MASVPVPTGVTRQRRTYVPPTMAAERVAEVVQARRVHADRHRSRCRQRVRERDEIRHALAQVVARRQQARQVDEMHPGGIDHAVRRPGRRCVVLTSRSKVRSIEPLAGRPRPAYSGLAPVA